MDYQKRLYHLFFQSVYDTLEAQRIKNYFELDCQNPKGTFLSNQMHAITEDVANKFITGKICCNKDKIQRAIISNDA
ncbi:hypothetical protein HYW54_03965 [Candidatus Gottesmanbacteria bacterium]|nr:hypothetical protein [Candidatus Gottesmanbacteria bacterium]